MTMSQNILVRTLIASIALVAGMLTVGGGGAATAATAAPKAPRVDSSATATRGALKVVWPSVAGARSYRATATPASGGTPVTATSSATSATVRGLAADTTYLLTVQAWNGSAWSAHSTALRATTLGSGSLYTFPDVPRTSPFVWETAWLASTGVTTGYGDRTFRPSQTVLREQMAAFLYRLAGSPAVPNLPRVSPFRDVPASSTFYTPIVWLASTGISTGYPDRTFRPSQPVLREQMAAFLHRFSVKTGTKASTTTTGGTFTDVPLSHVFATQVRWLARTGITTGYADGTFRPAQPVLREQMAAFLYRYRSMGPLTPVKLPAEDPAPNPTPTPTPTPTPAPTPTEPVETPDPCGTALRKQDGTTWACTFADNFDGTALDRSKWLAMETASNGYNINGDCYVDSPDNIAVSGGTLKLRAQRVAPMTCESPHGAYPSQHTAASLSTWGTFSQTYGRFEIRAKMPATTVAGAHSAWWLYPQNPSTYGTFPYSGEIDIAEFYSSWADRVIPMLHYGPTLGGAPRTNNYCMITDPTAFHTYTAEWTAEGISILYDGKLCLSHTWEKVEGMPLGAPFDQDYTLTLTQGIGALGNLATDATQFPATMEVDYVRVWA